MKNFILSAVSIILISLSFSACSPTNLGTKVICEDGECQVEEKGIND